jgi:peptide chain release factor 1
VAVERLDDFEREFADVENQLADPEVFGDQERYVGLTRRHKELDAIVSTGRALRQRQEDLVTAREMLTDAAGDDREVLRAEVDDAEAAITELTDQYRLLLLPKDPNDDKNVIVEVRGAEGGEEANLFARDLFEMYRAYAGRMGWSVDVLGSQPSDMGGVSEASFVVKGDGAWTHL